MREQLRHKTSVEHARVDALLGSLLLSDALDYKRFLHSHYHAYRILEKQTDVSLVQELTDLLRSDLKVMGSSHESLTDWPGRSFHLIAVKYVLGGSHFGKKILRKRWAKATDPHVRKAGSYLCSDLNGKIWSQFLLSVGNTSVSQTDRRVIFKSAKHTFALFEKGFEEAEKYLGGKEC